MAITITLKQSFTVMVPAQWCVLALRQPTAWPDIGITGAASQQNLTAWVIDVIRHAISGTRSGNYLWLNYPGGRSAIRWWCTTWGCIASFAGITSGKNLPVYRESDIVPGEQTATSILKNAQKILHRCLTPTSNKNHHRKDGGKHHRWSRVSGIFHEAAKRRRWVKEKYTRWVKTQPCLAAVCQPTIRIIWLVTGRADGNKSTWSLCVAFVQKASQRVHTDTVAFEDKYGSQLELIFVLSIARWQLAYWRKWRTSMNLKPYQNITPQNLQNWAMTLRDRHRLFNNYGCNGSAGDGASKAPLGLALFLAKVGVQDPHLRLKAC